MRTIGVVTVGRSDYGIYRSLLDAISADPELQLRLFVSGAHLSSEHGRTVQAIEAEGRPIAEVVDMLVAEDSPAAVAKSMGLGVIGFADALRRSRPDLLVVLGDRFEMFAATAAAVPMLIPLAHIHGGEVTEGAIDEQFRHAMTKMSHLHFVSTAEHGRRVRQMGEEPWRITVSGAPGLDALASHTPLSKAELEARLGLALDDAPLLVTFHPATLDADAAEGQVGELLAALTASARPVVLTYPNVDAGSGPILAALRHYVEVAPRAVLVDNLGTVAYFSLMARAAAMVGNSSSGIIEAPSFQLPVVNIGSRQQGRTRGANVIDVPCERQAIAQGIARALSPEFRAAGLAGAPNPYGDGGAARRIVDVLRTVVLDHTLITKRFIDHGTPAA